MNLNNAFRRRTGKCEKGKGAKACRRGGVTPSELNTKSQKWGGGAAIPMTLEEVHTYRHTYIHRIHRLHRLHTYLHTYIPASLHTCIPTSTYTEKAQIYVYIEIYKQTTLARKLRMREAKDKKQLGMQRVRKAKAETATKSCITPRKSPKKHPKNTALECVACMCSVTVCCVCVCVGEKLW